MSLTKGRLSSMVVANVVASCAALIPILAAPLVVGATTWFASNALGSAGGIGSISFGLRGWAGLAETILSILVACAILANAIEAWLHGFVRRLAALALAAIVAGVVVGWFVRAEALPWPGPMAIGLATGIEVFLVAATYWTGLNFTRALLQRRTQAAG